MEQNNFELLAIGQPPGSPSPSLLGESGPFLTNFKVLFMAGIVSIVPMSSGHIPAPALSMWSSPKLSLFTFLQTWTKQNTTNSYSSG